MRHRRGFYRQGGVCGLVLCLVTASAMGGEKDEQLLTAAEAGDVTAVTRLLGQGADVNARNGKGWTGLIFAARNGNLAVAKALLAKGAEVDARSHQGCTPLMCAAEGGHLELMKLLIGRGADCRAKDYSQGFEAIHFAARQGRRTAVELLLARGVPVEERSGTWQATPLIVAASNGRADVIELLLDKGANILAEDSKRARVLDCAVYFGKADSVRILLREQATMSDVWILKSLRYVGPRTPAEVVRMVLVGNWCHKYLPLDKRSIARDAFLSAVGRGDRACIKTLLEGPAGNDASRLKLAVQIAEQEGNVELQDFLEGEARSKLQRAEDRAKLNHELVIAAANGRYERVKSLILKGAEIDVPDGIGGDTALSEAAGFGQMDILRSLLDMYPDRDYLGKQGATLLNRAAANRQVKVVKYLAGRLGKNAKGLYDKSLTCLAETGDADIIGFLLDNGAQVDVRGYDNNTPLMDAAQAGKVEAVKLLLRRGADVNVQNKDGYTALALAKNGRYADIVRMLQQAGAQETAQDTNLPNPLIEAMPHLARFKELVAKGADVNKEYDGWTPLAWALNYGHVEAAKILIEHGASLKGSSLIFPINHDPAKIELVKLMVNKGADVNARGWGGMTPLMAAAEYREMELVRFLVAKGAKVNLKDSANRTALDRARNRGYQDVVEELQRAGAK